MSEIATRDDGELAPVTLFGSNHPADIINQQRELARTLTEVVRQQNLTVAIGQSEHLRVEAWTFLGSLLGVFPVTAWTRPVMDGDQQIGWEARVEARTRSGEVVGAAEAECLRTERTWKGREDYALKSMAQTRATSKALRLPLGFIVVLAGYNPTPADEMPGVIDQVSGGVPVAADDPPAVSQATVNEPATPPEDADLPEPLRGAEVIDFASDRMKKKLDVLVGKLRAAGHDPTGYIYAREKVAAVGVPDEERGHWGPLRDRLSKRAASKLIDDLEGILAKIEAKEKP